MPSSAVISSPWTRLCNGSDATPADLSLPSSPTPLGELGVLPDAFAHRFRGVAGFRNVLVHGYLGVDPERVHELLNSGLDDFLAFAQHVESYLIRCDT